MNKVKAGFFALAEVPDPNDHVAWNWWHSSDHIPENLAVDGIVLGERWAAPKNLRDARLADHPAFANSQYLIYYLFTEPVERVIRDFGYLGAQVTALGRMFERRAIPLAGHYDLVKDYVAPRLEISPEAVPFRPNRGALIVIVDLPDTPSRQAITRWYDRVHIPDMLTVRGIAGCYWFRSRGAHMVASPGVEDGKDWNVFLYFLDQEPMETMADLKAKRREWTAAGRALDTESSVRTILAAPFETIPDPSRYQCD